MADIQDLEELAVDLVSRLQAIEELNRATTDDYLKDSVVDMQTLAGAGLVAFMGNFSEERLAEIVQAIATVRTRRLRAPRQVVRAHDREDEEPAEMPPSGRAGIFILGEGVVR